MSDELAFTVDQAEPTPAQEISLADAGLRERSHLQEWVVKHPAIIGPDTLIVTTEFGRWASAAGVRDQDRLDVLGLSAEGQLVLAELKRGRAPDTIEMQALNYAARVSNFTVRDLATAHRKFLSDRGLPLTDDEARSRLEEHAPDLSDESVQSVPRVVLVAAEFGMSVTSTAVFLRKKLDVDIQLVRFHAYRTAKGETLITVSRFFPPPDVEEFALFPDAERQREEKRNKRREANTVARLLVTNALAPGTKLYLRPGPEVRIAFRQPMEDWLAEDPKRREVEWLNQAGAPLRWLTDQQAYSPTGLVKHIATLVSDYDLPTVAGPRAFKDEQGRTLGEIADEAEAEA